AAPELDPLSLPDALPICFGGLDGLGLAHLETGFLEVVDDALELGDGAVGGAGLAGGKLGDEGAIGVVGHVEVAAGDVDQADQVRSEEHTSELQSRENLVC